MSLLAELDCEFAWGILVVADGASNEIVPPWNGDELVAATAKELRIRVRHEQEGPAVARVWDGDDPLSGTQVFQGVLSLPSGVLVVSDAFATASRSIAMAPRDWSVSIYVDDVSEPTRIDIHIA